MPSRRQRNTIAMREFSKKLSNLHTPKGDLQIRNRGGVIRKMPDASTRSTSDKCNEEIKSDGKSSLSPLISA